MAKYIPIMAALIAFSVSVSAVRAEGEVAMAQSGVISAVAAAGQGDAPTDPREALGRAWVNESGWQRIADQLLVWTVYLRRLELIAPKRIARLSLPRQIVWIGKRYSTKSHPLAEVRSIHEKSKTRSKRQQWTNGLNRQCSEPKAWPKLPHPPWKAYEPLCKQIMKRARAFLRGEFQATCTASGTVDHWGGPMDDERGYRNGWSRVDFACVEGGVEHTPKNHAWCDPDLSDCQTERVYVYPG